jgi:hypothetical protein
MIFRYWIKLALISLVSVDGALAQKAPPSKPFERFDGCVLEPDEWTDGDSFRVRLPDGRLENVSGLSFLLAFAALDSSQRGRHLTKPMAISATHPTRYGSRA